MRFLLTGLVVASLVCLGAAGYADTPKPQNPTAQKSVPGPKVPAASEQYHCAKTYTATPASSTTAVNEFTCTGPKATPPVCSSTPKTDWEVGKPVEKGGKITYSCKRIPG